jgi:hypothetical protein
VAFSIGLMSADGHQQVGAAQAVKMKTSFLKIT